MSIFIHRSFGLYQFRFLLFSFAPPFNFKVDWYWLWQRRDRGGVLESRALRRQMYTFRPGHSCTYFISGLHTHVYTQHVAHIHLHFFTAGNADLESRKILKIYKLHLWMAFDLFFIIIITILLPDSFFFHFYKNFRPTFFIFD